jgi:hypothetical protein
MNASGKVTKQVHTLKQARRQFKGDDQLMAPDGAGRKRAGPDKKREEKENKKDALKKGMMKARLSSR